MLPMRDDKTTTTEDRATQPMEAGGWVSQFDFCEPQTLNLWFSLKYSPVVTTKYAPLFPCYSLLAMVIPPYQLHSPVATTGDFLLQGNPTVQCTHCAVLVKSISVVAMLLALNDWKSVGFTRQANAQV